MNAAPNPASRLPLLAGIGAVLLSGLYFWLETRAAARSPLWVDEVIALWSVHDIPAGGIVAAARQGIEVATPAYFLILKGAVAALGESSLALRLPCVVAFYFFLVAAFLLLRKPLGPPIALFSVSLLLLSGAEPSAAWARPFAILAACFAWSVFLWSRFAARRPSIGTTAALALVLAFAIAIHLYGLFVVIMVGLLEAAHAIRGRVFRAPVWAAILAGGASTFLWLPLIRAYSHNIHSAIQAPGFYARPSIAVLTSGLSGVFFAWNMVLIILAAMVVVFAWVLASRFLPPAPQPAAPDNGNPDVETLDWIALAALLYPLVIFTAAVLSTGVFVQRYFFGAALALSIAAARGLRALPSSEALALLLLLPSTILYARSSWSARPQLAPDPRGAVLHAAAANLPIVPCTSTDFFELLEQAPPEVARRLVYLTLPQALANHDDPDQDRVVSAWTSVRKHLPVRRLDAFLKDTPQFYFLLTPADRGRASLFLDGGNAILSARNGGTSLFVIRAADLPPAIRP